MSQVSNSHMGETSSLTYSILSDSAMNHPWGYGGTIPEHFTDQQYFSNAGRKKSKNRLNDQLIPKPTDINVAENMIKIATPREHPYSSHISRFAMFPSFCSPDDPETGVRAASQPFFNPHIPNSAPEVTLQSKTMGSPYRHEVLQSPAKSSKKAVTWTGDHGFLDYVKPLKGEKQVFYPTPPKTVLPNLKLRDPDLSLSERTSNMLKNLERSLWLTSYQLDYTGSGPANPIKIDDFQDKISSLPGINPHRTPLRERSFPVFVPSNPKQSLRRRQVSPVRRSSSSPSAGEHLQMDQAPDQSSSPATENQPAESNEAPHLQSWDGADFAGGKPSDLAPGVLHKQGTQSKMYEGRGNENRKVQFDESLIQKSVSQNSQEANAAQISKTEQALNLCSHLHSQGKVVSSGEKGWVGLSEIDKPSSKNVTFSCNGARDKTNIVSDADVLSRVFLEQQDGVKESQKLPDTTPNPCILPRPLPGIRSLSRAGTVGRAGRAVSVLELQDSFSKSEAHRNFNSSVTRAAVDLRDNIVTGKKHNFFGINCNYIHG